jgi:hypothetical protein
MKLFGIVVFVLSVSQVLGKANQRYSYRTKGNGATASASQSMECGYKSFTISASESTTKQGGIKAAQKTVWIYYSASDTCTGAETYGYAEMTPSNFTSDGKGTISATVTVDLQATVCAAVEGDGCYSNYECTDGAIIPVTGTVDWVRSGGKYTGKSTNNFKSGAYISRSKSTGTYFDATVTLDEFLFNGEAFTPDPDYGVYGQTFKTTEGYTDIYRQ